MNCVIYQKGSDEVTYFVRDCMKRGNDFIGSNAKLYGVKPALFNSLWTNDEVVKLETGWDKKVSEITPLAAGTEIAKPTHNELLDAWGRRDQIASMTFEQVENYIENNVTDLESAKAFLKVLAKVMLAVIKIQDKE